MPKGPQGQKRPADAIARAVMVAQIATGEIEDTTSGIGRAAGGKARAMVLSPHKRKEIAGEAAKARWQNAKELELDMKTAHNETGGRGREAVCMYPYNGLPQQKKAFKDAFSGFQMLRDRFKK